MLKLPTVLRGQSSLRTYATIRFILASSMCVCARWTKCIFLRLSLYAKFTDAHAPITPTHKKIKIQELRACVCSTPKPNKKFELFELNVITIFNLTASHLFNRHHETWANFLFLLFLAVCFLWSLRFAASFHPLPTLCRFISGAMRGLRVSGGHFLSIMVGIFHFVQFSLVCALRKHNQLYHKLCQHIIRFHIMGRVLLQTEQQHLALW